MIQRLKKSTNTLIPSKCRVHSYLFGKKVLFCPFSERDNITGQNDMSTPSKVKHVYRVNSNSNDSLCVRDKHLLQIKQRNFVTKISFQRHFAHLIIYIFPLLNSVYLGSSGSKFLQYFP